METIYCSLDARRLTVYGAAEGRRAGGGRDPVCYAFVPRRPVSTKMSKVVELSDYRPPREGAVPVEEPARPPRSRRRDMALLADLCASAAVVLLAAAAAIRFFTL